MLRTRSFQLHNLLHRFRALDLIRLASERVLDHVEPVRRRVAPLPSGLVAAAGEERTERGEAGADNSHVHFDVGPGRCAEIGV